MRKRFHLPKSKKCSTTGKTKYNTEDQANRIKMRIWSHDPSADIMDLHSYLCPDCKKFHVGHKSYFETLKKTQIEITDTVSIGVD